MVNHLESEQSAPEMVRDQAVSWTVVLTSAMAGLDCVVHGMGREARSVPVATWTAAADASDEALLDHCGDLTLDVGCGPGRMAQALTSRGHRVLGIDVLAEAVRRARSRGVTALRRSVFADLPGEGRWGCVLLADGNIGIGGRPVSLLRRGAALLAPGGRVVVDLAGPGAGLVTYDLQIECGGMQSRTFRWSVVDPASITDVAHAAGLRVRAIDQHAGRWYAVLTKDRR